MHYIGQRTDANNLDDLPAYTRVDASIGYDFGCPDPRRKGVRAQVTAANLSDTYRR